jgi:hypothetical protein
MNEDDRSFDSAPAEPVLPMLCQLLRAENARGTIEGGKSPWLLLDPSTSVHWCLCTMANHEPDDEVAHSDRCREGRGCFTQSYPDVDLDLS